MKNVKTLSIDLSILDEEVPPDSNEIEHKTKYDLPEEQGKLEGLFLQTSHDIVLYRGDYEFNADVIGPEYDFGHIKGIFSEDTLLINTCLGGFMKQIDHNYLDDSAVETQSSYFGQDLTSFRVMREFHQETTFQTANKVVNGALTITISSLKLLIGADSTEKLMQFLGATNPHSTKVHRIPIRITQILHAAINPRFTGSMKQLYCQTKSLEYLCELVELMEKQEKNTGIFDEKRALVIDIHDTLMCHSGRLPTLVELAEQYGVPARTLNTQFQNEYGLSINKYMTQVRLNKAHKIVQNHDTALKVIAAKLGYSHVNHFITAFKQEFGYPPGSLRK